MFKRLFAFLSRQPDPASIDKVEEDEPENDAASIARAAGYRNAMEQFTRLVSRQLGEPESERLTRNVLERLDDSDQPADRDEVANCFFEGLMDDQGQQRGGWLIIQVDHKASEEIDWQANEMLATRGIDDPWQWDWRGKTVMHGLAALSERLSRHALSLLSVDFGHDAYYMLIVDDEIARRATELGRRAGLDVMSWQDFAVSQGED